MYEALLLDFYGTVVHEDDEVVASICRTIADTTNLSAEPSDIGRHWWQVARRLALAQHGAST